MTVQACMLLTDAKAAQAMALNATSTQNGGGSIETRKIDNPVSNQIVGLGDLTGNVLGRNYLTARVLTDPLYTTFLSVLQNEPVYILDSELLFLPQEEV
jgi:hypothetical protein